MRQLSDRGELAALELRLASLSPNTTRLWGKMSPEGMLCHLCDSFRFALDERPVLEVSNAFSRTVMKWVALHTSLPWPKGIGTRPEVDQTHRGTRPTTLDGDRAELIGLMRRFAEGRMPRPNHPIFGPMTEQEWQHWAWRHTDHHLRQFGL